MSTKVEASPLNSKEPNAVLSNAAEPKKNVLLKFRHGLGDAIQLTIVLQHLRHYHPDWNIEVAALPGKQTAYSDLCDRAFALNGQPIASNNYDQVHDLDWEEAATCFAEYPSTKATRCLREIFGLVPMPELCRYRVTVSPDAEQRARGYLSGVCNERIGESGRYPAVLIHYQGNTSGPKKDISHSVVEELCEIIVSSGYVPVILDWDNRSPLIGKPGVFNPAADDGLWGNLGTGDAEVLAALIESASLMIGIDSGPLHVAGATTTPTIGVWTKHHPVHYFDLAANVTHLVPDGHAKLAKGQPAVKFFRGHYCHHVYSDIHIDLPAMVKSKLTGEKFEELKNKRFLRTLHSKSFTRQYYEEHQQAGLDYLGHGDWQCNYGQWLAEALDLRNKRVLDVGCACGSIVRGLGNAGMVVQGVDVNEYTIGLGRKKWPGMANLLHVADAVNLHLYSDDSWDAIHSAQVAEHWKPELVDEILRELWRVTRPGGLFICFLDTEELFERQGRTIENEDPTHVCVKPLRWWHEKLASNGWEVCSDKYTAKLHDHTQSYLGRYDWDWFIARKSDLPPRHISSDVQVESPIFVSGLPRSGTTWMQHFLSAHPDIHIHGQFPNVTWGELWAMYQRLLGAGETAGSSNQRLKLEIAHYAGSPSDRSRQLFRQFLRDYLAGYGVAKAQWGLKTLTLCIEPGAVEQVESIWPEARWLVCIRNPFDTMESERNTFRPNADWRCGAASWLRTCRFASDHAPERTTTFQLDRLQEDEAREVAGNALLKFLGVEPNDRTTEFLRQNPAIHRSSQENWTQRLTSQDKRRLLEEFEDLAACCDRWGYATETL